MKTEVMESGHIKFLVKEFNIRRKPFTDEIPKSIYDRDVPGYLTIQITNEWVLAVDLSGIRTAYYLQENGDIRKKIPENTAKAYLKRISSDELTKIFTTVNTNINSSAFTVLQAIKQNKALVKSTKFKLISECLAKLKREDPFLEIDLSGETPISQLFGFSDQQMEALEDTLSKTKSYQAQTRNYIVAMYLLAKDDSNFPVDGFLTLGEDANYRYNELISVILMSKRLGLDISQVYEYLCILYLKTRPSTGAPEKNMVSNFYWRVNSVLQEYPELRPCINFFPNDPMAMGDKLKAIDRWTLYYRLDSVEVSGYQISAPASKKDVYRDVLAIGYIVSTADKVLFIRPKDKPNEPYAAVVDVNLGKFLLTANSDIKIPDDVLAKAYDLLNNVIITDVPF